MKDKLHLLAFINPWNAVKVIFLFGAILVIYKIIESRKKLTIPNKSYKQFFSEQICYKSVQ